MNDASKMDEIMGEDMIIDIFIEDIPWTQNKAGCNES